jgi:probable rRNA maturation factor
LKTTVINRQKISPLRLSAVRALAAHLASALEETDPQTLWDEVTLLLTDDAGILHYNREFFGKDRSTDVISFRSAPMPGDEGITGDLIVNVECAWREGPRHEGFSSELALYIAHGFNHLSGAEDNTPARRAAMRRTERKRLVALQNEIANLSPEVP